MSVSDAAAGLPDDYEERGHGGGPCCQVFGVSSCTLGQ